MKGKVWLVMIVLIALIGSSILVNSCSSSNPVIPKENNPTQLTLYASWYVYYGLERNDSAWVVKDSSIQMKCRDQDSNLVTDIIWHCSNPTIAEVNSQGKVKGLKDWFDNGNVQPVVTVWASKDSIESNRIVVQTVINLNGMWVEEGTTFESNVWMGTTENGPTFHHLGALNCCLSILGDYLFRNIPPPERQFTGHILENGTRIELIESFYVADTIAGYYLLNYRRMN